MSSMVVPPTSAHPPLYIREDTTDPPAVFVDATTNAPSPPVTKQIRSTRGAGAFASNRICENWPLFGIGGIAHGAGFGDPGEPADRFARAVSAAPGDLTHSSPQPARMIQRTATTKIVNNTWPPEMVRGCHG